MTVSEFKAQGAAKYGYGWQTKFARLIDVTPVSVNHWVKERYVLPKYAQIIMRALPDIETNV